MANQSIYDAFEQMWEHTKVKLNGKSDTGHTHNYAGSSSAGGSANSVKGKLNIEVVSTSSSPEGVMSSTSNYTYNGNEDLNIELNLLSSQHTHATTDITSGTLGVARGGTGQTSAINAANSFLNALSTGTSNPQDADYYISQYVGGGTTTTTYHRRPMSALWNYIAGKADSRYLKLTGGTLTGALTGTSITATTFQAGSSSTNGGLELYHATPFIDFHFGRSTADFTSRIIETASGTLAIQANHVRCGISSNSDYKTLYVVNSLHVGGLHTSAAGNMGVFSDKFQKWLIRMDSSGHGYVPVELGLSGGLYAASWVQVGGTSNGTCTSSLEVDWLDTAADTMTITEGLDEGVIVGKTIFGPYTTKTYNLGNANYRWKQLYATTATINTSDRNLKKDFKTFDSNYEKFFMDLKPMIFKFKDGESGRDHFGFIAQDVEDSLLNLGFTTLDFAGLCKDAKCKQQEHPKTKEERRNKKFKVREELEPELDENGNVQYEYSLRYEEFISLNTYMIQETIKENQELKNKIIDLESRIQKLEGGEK